jgi:hypothetical protein
VKQGSTTIADVRDLLIVARRLFWWKPTEEALSDRSRFIAQMMALGTWDDVQITRSIFGDDAFRQVLSSAPPGVIDERSWVYWHNYFGISPIPPLPQRSYGE